MDELGQRIIRDTEAIAAKRDRASQLEAEARKLRRDADEMERLLELARFQR
jgi:hypothetical protein